MSKSLRVVIPLFCIGLLILAFAVRTVWKAEIPANRRTVVTTIHDRIEKGFSPEHDPPRIQWQYGGETYRDMLLSHMVVSGEKNHGIGDSLEMYINPDKPNKVFHKEQYDMLLMLIYLLVPFELVTFCALAVSRKQMKADQNTCTDNLQD